MLLWLRLWFMVKKIKGEGTEENAKFTELLKVIAPMLPVVVVAFPQLKKIFLKVY